MTNVQLNYTIFKRIYNGDYDHITLANQGFMACYFTIVTTFNLAHWLFAFSYLVLSYRMELKIKGLPEDTHNCHLNTVNIVVCLLNVALPLISWIYYMRGQRKVADIVGYVE